MLSALRKSIKEETSLSRLWSNALSGITIGVIALPLSMALAIAVGVAPQYGLYTAIVAGIVTSITGGSQVNISGPTAAFVVILIPIVDKYGFNGLLVSGFLAGIILILMGWAKLGRLIEVIPYSVIIGFTSGIGLVIATLQLKSLFGLTIEDSGNHFIDSVILLVESFNSIDLSETLVGAITLAILIFWPRLKSKIPGHLIAIFVGSLAAIGISLINDDSVIRTIGNQFHYQFNGIVGNGIPPIMPTLNWPWAHSYNSVEPLIVDFALIRTLLPEAFTIAFLGALESLLCAVVADGMSGKKHNPDDELIGQGIGNLITPLFGGIPATAALARTAANIRSGASAPWSSIIHSVFILFSILFLSSLLAYIPMASIAALLIVVAWNMSEAKHFIRIIKEAPKNDVLVLLTCFFLTVLMDMTIAVMAGILLASLLFIKRSIDTFESQFCSIEHDNIKNIPKEIAIYDINGPLFFGTAQKALKNLTLINPEIRAVILDMSKVTMLDMSAIMAMESIIKECTPKNIIIVINDLQPRMLVKLKKAGIGRNENIVVYSRGIKEALDKAKLLIYSEE